MASFGKKISPETAYITSELSEKFSIFFPFDLHNFFKALETPGKTFIPLSNHEIPLSLYENKSDEEFQIIDKQAIDQPEILSLLSPENPDLLLIGFGNHLEELVKCSQLLETQQEPIGLKILEKWELLFSEKIQKDALKAKKIGIILDHEINPDFALLLKKIKKPTILLSPKYKKLTSIFPEYQNEQTEFDALNLFKRGLESA